MRYVKISIGALLIALLTAQCFKKEGSQDESILKGHVSILVDATVMPIIEDEIDIFESVYDAKIDVVSKSEAEVVNSLMKDSIQVAILSRNLTEKEQEQFRNKNIIPRMTKFAVDAVTLIKAKESGDSLIVLNDVIKFLQGNAVSGIKGLVFDNLNSSTLRYLSDLAKIKAIPTKGIYSFSTNEETIKYVAENKGMIGVVGLNWISQPEPKMEPYISKISILSVQGYKDHNFYGPTQNNLAEGKYPLARDLVMVNCQGYSGLGMGFASFIAGERGQRIVLKSGLLPAKIPARKVLLRKQIEKSNK